MNINSLLNERSPPSTYIYYGLRAEIRVYTREHIYMVFAFKGLTAALHAETRRLMMSLCQIQRRSPSLARTSTAPHYVDSESHLDRCYTTLYYNYTLYNCIVYIELALGIEMVYN